MVGLMDRRMLAVGLAALFPLLSQSAWAQQDNFRIGLITQMSGYAQAYGAATQVGAEIAIDRINAAGGVNGRKLELVVRDDKGSTDAAVSAYRELYGAGIRFFITGPISGPSVAVTPLIKDEKVLMICSGSTNLSITHELYNPNVFRIGFTTVPYHGGLTQEVAKRNPNIKKWAAISSDPQTIRDIVQVLVGGLKKNYAKLHGSEISFSDAIITKSNAGDFRNQLTQLANTDAEGLVSGLVGSDAITFYKQARAFGLDSKYKVIVDLGGELQMAKALGENLHPNMWSPAPWFEGANRDNQVSNDLYKEAARRMNDKFPFGYVAYAYDSVLTLAEAARAAKSFDTDAMRAAIESGSPLGATGKIVYRKEDHNYLGDLTFLNFGADPAGENGWKIKEVVKISSDGLVEPATPGRKFDLQ